jgi:hypothetical protein
VYSFFLPLFFSVRDRNVAHYGIFLSKRRILSRERYCHENLRRLSEILNQRNYTVEQTRQPVTGTLAQGTETPWELYKRRQLCFVIGALCRHELLEVASCQSWDVWFWTFDGERCCQRGQVSAMYYMEIGNMMTAVVMKLSVRMARCSLPRGITAHWMFKLATLLKSRILAHVLCVGWLYYEYCSYCAPSMC